MWFGYPLMLTTFIVATTANLPQDFSSLNIGINPRVIINRFMCSNLTRILNITPMCRQQLDVICRDSDSTMRMADAWTSFPYTGMFASTRIDLGTFDQCMAVDITRNGVRVLGKHCALGIVIPTTDDVSDPVLWFESAFKLSYCVPDQCIVHDVTRFLPLVPTELINDEACVTKESGKELDSESVVILTIFCIVIGLMLVATIRDLVLYAKGSKSRRSFLMAFSVFTNTQKLFRTAPSNTREQIQCFHGMKVVSMMWIVAGHVAVAWGGAVVTNDAVVNDWVNQRYSFYKATAHLAVDTFFYISGFLLAYQYFKSQAQKPAIVQVQSLPVLIFNRYLRLTPGLLMIYLYLIGLARYVGSGPVHKPIFEQLRQPCIDNWWTVFLYIQNYYNPTYMCMTSLWYVSADMQLFVFAPLVMIPIAVQWKKSFNMALIELLVLNLVFMGLPIFTKLMFKEFDPTFVEFDSHSRLIDYFIGFTCGFYMRQNKDRSFRFGQAATVCFWIVSLGGMLGTMLVLHEINTYHGYTAKALCYSFMRPVWCLALSWIVYACVNGRGGAINSILSNGMMQILGKITFSIYLVHANVIYVWGVTTRTSRYFSDLEMFYTSCGIFIVSCVVGLFWTLAFESPVIVLTGIMMGHGGTSTKPAVVVKSTEKTVPIENS